MNREEFWWWRDLQEEKKKRGSAVSFMPEATACHHICIKAVSGSTCWLSEPLLWKNRRKWNRKPEGENKREKIEMGWDRRGREGRRAGEAYKAANWCNRNFTQSLLPGIVQKLSIACYIWLWASCLSTFVNGKVMVRQRTVLALDKLI